MHVQASLSPELHLCTIEILMKLRWTCRDTYACIDQHRTIKLSLASEMLCANSRRPTVWYIRVARNPYEASTSTALFYHGNLDVTSSADFGARMFVQRERPVALNCIVHSSTTQSSHRCNARCVWKSSAYRHHLQTIHTNLYFSRKTVSPFSLQGWGWGSWSMVKKSEESTPRSFD